MRVFVNDDGEIQCVCMDEPSYDGFSTCHRDGTLDDSLLSIDEYVAVYFRCDRCGAIFSEETLEIINAKEAV